MNLSTEDSQMERRLDAIEERLERQSRLIDRHIEIIDRRDNLRRNWNLFWCVLAGHCLINCLCLSLLETIAYPLYLGAVTGSIITLGVWHGLSSRSFFQRWQRTLLASAIGIMVACFALDVGFDSVGTVIALQAVFVMAPTIIIADLIGRVFRVGFLAPGEVSAATRKLNLLSALRLSALVALLLALTRFSIGLIDPTAQSSGFVLAKCMIQGLI